MADTRRRGLRPRRHARERRRPALCPRGEPESRPVQRRRVLVHGARGRVGLRHPGRKRGEGGDGPGRRQGRDTRPAQAGLCMTAAAGRITTRPLQLSDRARVEAMTRAVGLFREEEIPVAVEVFEATAAANDTYEGLAAVRDGELVGWISWGPTPGTLGTFDLYWIVIDPACHGQGIGTVLVD